jgi:hypothetical protein
MEVHRVLLKRGGEMERKHAFLGILVVVVVSAFCLGGPGAAVPAAAQGVDGGLGQFPTDHQKGDTGPPKPGPLEADPDWFGTNVYDRMPIVEVKEPARRSGWTLFGPYGGLLDWLYRGIVEPSVVAIRY